jgi:hypothetical protein
MEVAMEKQSNRFHAGRNDKGRNPEGNYNSESAGK